MSGFGQNVGQNVGGGGIPYLTDLTPLPEDFIPNDLHVHLTVGVQGSLIDLSKTKIYLSFLLVFDGSTVTFTPDFVTGSSFIYDAPNNGYAFDIQVPLVHLEAMAVVEVSTSTTDGTDSTQTYSFRGGPDYPPTPFGAVIGEIFLNRFSGESQEGLLSGSQGLVFMSPALQTANSGNEVDIDSLESRVITSDPYELAQTPNPRPFLVGPPLPVPPISPPPFPPQFSDSYIPVLNDPNYALMNTKPTVRGVMFDSVSLETSVILY